MNQEQYNDIVRAINFGFPAKANELITALNNVVNKAQETKGPEVKKEEKEIK